MNILSNLLFIWFIQSIIIGQVNEVTDPTVTQFVITRGTDDPDFTGDLSLNIPLLTVPGVGGLDFNTNLKYLGE
jgi:hypothetical protein